MILQVIRYWRLFFKNDVMRDSERMSWLVPEGCTCLLLHLADIPYVLIWDLKTTNQCSRLFVRSRNRCDRKPCNLPSDVEHTLATVVLCPESTIVLIQSCDAIHFFVLKRMPEADFRNFSLAASFLGLPFTKLCECLSVDHHQRVCMEAVMITWFSRRRTLASVSTGTTCTHIESRIKRKHDGKDSI